MHETRVPTVASNADILYLHQQNANKDSFSPQDHINKSHGMYNMNMAIVLVFSIALNGSISFILSGKFVQFENSGDTKPEIWNHNPKHLNIQQNRYAKLNSGEQQTSSVYC